MTIKIRHHEFFLNALRTAIIFIAGFITYELLKELESKWNKTHPNNELTHLARSKGLHFLFIFIIDLLILYAIALLFDIHL
jgi:hypothetical protein